MIDYGASPPAPSAKRKQPRGHGRVLRGCRLLSAGQAPPPDLRPTCQRSQTKARRMFVGIENICLSLPAERRCLYMAIEQQREAVASAKSWAKWFKVEITISLFGQQIIHWVIPPEEKK